jgi:hypothetical protein
MTLEQMNEKQVHIARHALGLTRQKRSYRNMFNTSSGTDDNRELELMVAAGWATKRPGWTEDDNYFHITPQGVSLVLQPGESAPESES